VAYAIRFALKHGDDALDDPVMPLQGLWWATAELVARAIAKVRRSRPAVAVDGVRLARLAEGRCAQVLHTGPYSRETPTIDRLHAFIRARGCVPSGRHHEIYLSDPSRTAPEKLKTIIRYPVAVA
jgi:hypothetical protein